MAHSLEMEKLAIDDAESELSSLESLPKELVWKVIEYTPATALSLRTASASLMRQVNDFALAQSTLPLVEKVTLGAVRLPNSTKKPEQVDVNIKIPDDREGLFYLRLKLRGHEKFLEEIRAMDPSEQPKLVQSRKQFAFPLHTDEEGIEKKVEKLAEWLGRRIGKVEFLNCSEEKVLPALSRVLEHTQFSRLKLTADSLPEHLACFTLQLMLEKNVKELELAGRFETKINTVNLLRQLSSHIRSMQIYQTPVTATTEGQNVSSNHLFGANDVDWAPLIVEMFAGALDKLAIVNPNFSGYLSASGTDKLIETLPRLDKKVHFIATCDQYSEGLTSDSHKDYSVKVNPPPPVPAGNNQAPPKPKQFLQIKHKTRENEPPLNPSVVEVECK